MPEKLKLKAGSKVPFPDCLYEGYEQGENSIVANVGIDKVEAVMRHFISMHDEPLFFILELPANLRDCPQAAPGDTAHWCKNIYYIDGCTQEKALAILEQVGGVLFQDGISTFGFGCHKSHDEILFGKYNVLIVYSENISQYPAFFEAHKIPKTERLTTAWDTFSMEHPGDSMRYAAGEKTVYAIPEQLKSWGMYLAEQKEDR